MPTNPFEYMTRMGGGHHDGNVSEFDQLEATELYCPQCGRAVPVRKTLLLVLPEGDKYEYSCQFCGGKVGDKIDRTEQFQGIIRP